MKKVKIFGIITMLIIMVVPSAMAILTGVNPDIHMDIPNATANDFHIEGRIYSGFIGGNWSMPPVLVFHIDGGFPEFSYSITPDYTSPGQNEFIFKADWKGKEFHYCEVLHLGLVFDLACHNLIIDLVGWWTYDGEQLYDGENQGAVLIPGFEVLDFPADGGPQKIQIRNDSSMLDQGIDGKIVQMNLAKLKREEALEMFGSLEELFAELRSDGRQNELRWTEIVGADSFPIEQNPPSFSADSFFDVFFELDLPGVAYQTTESLALEPSDILVSRVGTEFINNAGEPDFRWTWHMHEAHHLDYGDAPQQYPVLLMQNGARHIIRGPWFGDLRDRPDMDPDGQPHPQALGDDLNDGNDDEDGVGIPILSPGNTASINVEVFGGGIVDAWIDYNQDFVWDEPAERIYGGFLPAGMNVINVNVPNSALPGQTFARFRISEQGGLLPEGFSNNGEVEDHLVDIEELQQVPEADLGDAPDSSNNSGVGMTAYPGIPANYPTVYGTGSPPHGPIHWYPRELAYLGQRVTLEDEADTGPDEDPTNNIIPLNDSPDRDLADDGVIFPINVAHCDYNTLDYVVTVVNAPANNPLYVNIWFDWNKDGDWDDRFECPDGITGEEWAVQNQELFFFGTGTFTVTSLPFLANLVSVSSIEEVWMRITLSDSKYEPVVSSDIQGYGGSGPKEGYKYGETEDYLFIPDIPLEYDFGDAPDQVGVTAVSPYHYRTVLANNGARHVLGSTIFMSPANVLPDAEPDGQPTNNAKGDDLNGIDDEDGVSFTNLPLIPGKKASVIVEASQDCFLSAWVDFYLDGSFDQPEDKIFSNEPLVPGPNPLEFDVPLYAKQMVITYARFRVSSAGGLHYYGEARDGEVEDYTVRIGRNIDIKWMQRPDTTPDGIDIRVDTSDGIQRVLADDFLCSHVEQITDVHLWGSWKDDNKGRIRRIHLSFHSDDPVGPGGTDQENIYSKPDELLWEKDFYEGEFAEKLFVQLEETGEYWWDPFRGVLKPDGDKQIWQVDIDIKPEEAFVQKGTEDRPIVYWLDVQVDTDEGEFGWKTRRWPSHYNDDAVLREDNSNWKELRYPAGHAYAPLMFEDLAVGTEYFVGDVFTTSGIDVHVMDFEWSDGTLTSSGRAIVDNNQLAGGSGNDINCNNVNLLFDFPDLYNLDLLYGEYGGNVNLEINGDKRNVEDFDVLNGTLVGGVMVTILTNPTATSANQKIMHLDGKIKSFSIGGQELWIDNVGSSSIDMAFALTSKKIPGDFNGNGVVDIVDALLTAQCFVGLIPCPSTMVADVNCDGSTDIIDALLIAQYYVGLISSLGC